MPAGASVQRQRHGLIVLLGLLSLAVPAPAEVVRYTDANGNFVYVEGLQGVPERFRSTAVPLASHGTPTAPTTEVGISVPAGGTTIRYTPGQRIMVDVRINGGSPAKLLLDTGADRTMISPGVLTAAGVSLNRPIGQGQMAGVGGTDRVWFVLVDSLEIGDAKVRRMPVAVYEIPHAPGDGLLGRDFLERFMVNIDSGRGVVTLSPK
jgi:Aspartyl protease